MELLKSCIFKDYATKDGASLWSVYKGAREGNYTNGELHAGQVGDLLVEQKKGAKSNSLGFFTALVFLSLLDSYEKNEDSSAFKKDITKVAKNIFGYGSESRAGTPSPLTLLNRVATKIKLDSKDYLCGTGKKEPKCTIESFLQNIFDELADVA